MTKNGFYLLILLFFMFVGSEIISAQPYSAFHPGEIWKDNNGIPINAHGGGILYHKNKYYWFGEHKGEDSNNAFVGVTCYSSSDLYNWQYEGVALSVENDTLSDIVSGCIIERPKVIYNIGTKKFIMYFHLELKGRGYSAARVGIAVSDKATGPYRFLKSLRPNAGRFPENMTEAQRKAIAKPDDFKKWWTPEWHKAMDDGMYVRRDWTSGQMSRDMTLFVDDDGKAYHIYASEENLTLHLAELTKDYLGYTGKYVRIAPAGHNEAPALFKKDGKYFMITSGCTGWEPNAARLFTADMIYGAWIQHPNPCCGADSALTFHSQSTCILPVQGKKDAFIFMADRWRPKNPIDGRYVWLPIRFENGLPVLQWQDEWDLNVGWEDSKITSSAKNKLVVNADQGKDLISKHIYGHFSEHLGHCIYSGYWVGEDSPIPNMRGIRKDVVNALKDIQIPNLRWPGGCFADEYHWMDGIGPRNKRPKMVNTHWGGVTEDNSFGTHEFLDLCEQLGCEPYISGNLGSGSVEEMSKWVEYITFDGESPMANLRRQNGREKPWKVKFWGVGNESWGCGGNMTPDHYSDLYRRYATYCRDYGDNHLYKIACGASDADYNWTETVMKNVGNRMQGLSLHYYTIPTGNWGKKGSATQFDESEYFATIERTLYMEELVSKHSTIMDKYDPQKRIGLMTDEWGIWTEVEPGSNPGFLYQQNSLRDAILAGINLNIFNNHCDRVKMANIAQTVNVLQAVILTEKEKMLLTPTYWVYYLYKVHQDATLLPVSFTSATYELNGKKMNAISVSASKDASGKIHITLVNIEPNKAQTIEADLRGVTAKKVSGKILTSAKINDYNTFERPNTVSVKDFKDAKLSGSKLNISLPAKSVLMLEIE